MESDKLIGQIEKNQFEVIRVSLGWYKGKNYVHIRAWSRGEGLANTEVLQPTKKGVCLNVELLPELKKLIDKALVESEHLRPAEEGKEPW